MRDFVNPRNVQPEVSEAFRQIQIILKGVQIPVLKDMRSIKAIPENTSAYHKEGNKLYRYTKVAGTLFKELVSEGLDEAEVQKIADDAAENAVEHAPHTTPEEAREIADEEIANAPYTTEPEARQIADEEVAKAPRPTLTATTEKRTGMVGEIRQELLSYDVGNPPPVRFNRIYYLSYEDAVNENPIPEEQIPQYVADENWNPATPRQEPGTHHTIFTFRHIVAGTILVSLGAE